MINVAIDGDHAVKTDWTEHRERLAQMREKQDVTIKEYADLYGLNHGTARRNLGVGTSQVGAKSAAQPAARSVPRSKTPPRSIDRKPKTDRKRDQSATPAEESAASKIKALSEQVHAAKAGGTAQGAETPAGVLTGQLMDVVARKTKSGRAGDQSKAGAQVLVGSLVPDDDDLAAAEALMTRAGVDDIEARMIRSALVNQFALERAVSQMLEHLEDHTPGEDEPPTINKAVSVLAAAAASMNDTARTMAGVRQSYSKDQREQQLHLRKLSEPERVMEAYKRRKEEKWSAMETAIYIEAHGYKVPSLLLELARAEMKEGEGDDINAQPVDLMELDRKAREQRAERMAALEATLAEKREAVNVIVDDMGAGDVAADGSLNDLNLMAEFTEGEEPDDEINTHLYGDNEDGHQQEG